MAEARIIALSNQKGGVGKTTSAVNIAASLAAAEYRVLLVDFDPQGNASSALGVESRSLKPSSYEMLIQESAPADCIVKTELSYLDLIPANQELIGAEIELVSALGREHRLKDALNLLKNNYDFILIDCPPALGLLTVNALVAAHGILVPLQCEYFALEGLSQLMKTVELVKKFLNPSLDIEGILLTMFDRRNNLSHQVEVDVREHFKDTVLSTKIPRNVKLGEAPSHGKPIILYDISSPGALAYMEAAQELLARTQLKRITPAQKRNSSQFTEPTANP
ncbi:MAG: ParA family protein [Proteobacteria bacterium]|nr:ParA family protein [Pseudomonadota bacterium]